MKVMVGLIIVILITSLVTLFWPTSLNDSDKVSDINDTQQTLTSSQNPNVNDQGVDETENSHSAEDLKIEQMTAAYDVLEKDRKTLKRRLARLRHDMWDLKFPPEQAREIKEILVNAHKLIKNPDMLGAFSSVDDINNELTKVSFADKSLDRIYQLIEENKSTDVNAE